MANIDTLMLKQHLFDMHCSCVRNKAVFFAKKLQTLCFDINLCWAALLDNGKIPCVSCSVYVMFLNDWTHKLDSTLEQKENGWWWIVFFGPWKRKCTLACVHRRASMWSIFSIGQPYLAHLHKWSKKLNVFQISCAKFTILELLILEWLKVIHWY